MNKYLGIDYGAGKIGLAISDDDGRMAFPYSIIENKNKGNVSSKILEICNKKGIQKIVLGESLNYHGEKNLIMKEVERLKIELEKQRPVYYEQEFLTSHQASKSKNQEINPPTPRLRRTRKSKKPIDDSAAAIILQSYLDKKNEINN